MRLLVSVRSAEEAGAAVRGGADIIDAKEPSAGVLAPVTAPVLRAIADAVPQRVPLSAALGDVGSANEATAAIAALALGSRTGPTYAKFGLPNGAVRVEEIVGAAVEAARTHTARPSIVVAVYVDRLMDLRGDLRTIAQASADARAYGMLLDTAEKNGRSLLDWCNVALLVEFTEFAHSLGLKVALAGSVGEADLSRLATTGADIVGVRGAVCEGGRDGSLDASRVSRFAKGVGNTPFHAKRP